MILDKKSVVTEIISYLYVNVSFSLTDFKIFLLGLFFFPPKHFDCDFLHVVFFEFILCGFH